MSTDKGEGISTHASHIESSSSQTSSAQPEQSSTTASAAPQPQPKANPATPPKLGEEAETDEQQEEQDRKLPARRDPTSASTAPSTPPDDVNRPRQVIAVSASKGPTAFFNLARKFLVTDEMCDLSALEGAIVSAVDAAHLLERSKLATIVRVQTSYVTVEPKRRKQPPGSPQFQQSSPARPADASPPPAQHSRGRSAGRELRRARIVITVKRTESYKRWLDENPVQAIMAGDGREQGTAAAAAATTEDQGDSGAQP